MATPRVDLHQAVQLRLTPHCRGGRRLSRYLFPTIMKLGSEDQGVGQSSSVTKEKTNKNSHPGLQTAVFGP